jgi:hypothetical protein
MTTIPQYFDQYQYSLQLEYLDLDMFFVVDDEGVRTDVLNRKTFTNFLNLDNSKSTPFVIRNVNHITKSDDFRPWDGPIEDYLNRYSTDIDFFCSNLIATSPSTNTKLLVRTKDLVFFAKYFEGWAIESIPFATNRNHISQFNIFSNIVTNVLRFQPNLGQLIATTLICNLIKTNEGKPIPQVLKNNQDDYTASGIMSEYNSIASYIDDWIMFCKKLQFRSFPKDLANNDLEIVLSNIFSFSRQYTKSQFFHTQFNSSSTQNVLIKTLPFEVKTQRLYSEFS